MVECTGKKTKNHHSHSAIRPVQVNTGMVKQKADGVFHSHFGLIGKLKGAIAVTEPASPGTSSSGKSVEALGHT